MAITEKPTTQETHELEERWEDAPGIPGFFNTVDHKRIGMRYIYTAFAFFFIAGALALVMRVQLAQPNAGVLSPESYNEFFTMHGTTMIFLFNTPVLAGFGNYLVPLMLGSRDMAFPRLNAFSYWIFLLAGLFLFSSFLVGHPPNGGWFAYTPLTSKPYSSGINIDFWGLGVVFIGISTTVGAINFIVSIFKLRAPGMTLNRMPIFVWSMLVFSFMVIFSVPAVTVAAGLLELDRLFGTAFYSVGGGGSVLLYQHLFWFWGHPEVYILFIPATGMVSMIIPVFSRRPLAGYLWIATALVTVGFISFGVWVHHMFATGMPALALSFFSAVSLIITLPSGVQFFAWIATMWKGVVRFSTAMLFAIGFLLIFLLGGITGVMVAILPFDWQVTDSYFVVAHFHYVLNGAVVFPIFGALYFWLPKMTGRMLDERLGKISFWTMFVGFNVAFFPMHILGFLGMPRRIYTYDSGLGWDGLNLLISIASFVFAAGTLMTLYNFVRSQFRGAPAPPNPWDADSLEWSTSSPPPEYNFAAMPVVTGRHPLWDPHPAAVETTGDGAPIRALGVAGALDKEMPVSEGMDARPQDVLGIPSPTYLPFVTAVGVGLLFVGLLVEATLIGAVGVLIGASAIVRWLWRTSENLT
ncbi:MAG TPA: cytochrome c oxidase subunit I [Acidimicrobiia bacterium]|nr:cytochrome c oxidase subunit I [Acidimicrobiia bacterium]